MKSYILLDNIEFYAYHGVFEQETIVGNVFLVSLKIELDLLVSCKTDELADTVSYGDVFALVKQEMDVPSKLLEHVAYRIIQCLRCTYPQIGTIEIRLSKRNPPVGASAQIEYATILLIDEI